MNILLLGGNGFIGSHLLDHLHNNNHKIRVFDRQPELFRKPRPDVEYFIGDFGNRAMLTKSLKGIDLIFHLISTTIPQTSNNDPAFDIQSNVVETIFLLEQCVKECVKEVVFLSSGGAVYGTPAILPVSEASPTNPESSYGITKLTIEKYLMLFHRLYGLNYMIIRPSNPYGPRQNPLAEQGVIAVFLDKISKGQTIEIWGDGQATKDYIFIDDLIRGILKAAFSKTESKIFNLGSGIGYSLNDIVQILKKVVSKRIKIVYTEKRLHDVYKIYLDITRAKFQLGWEPITPLDLGIRNTWEFGKGL